MTTGEAVAAGTAYLDARGIETPRVDAELIVGHVLGRTRSSLHAERDRLLGEGEHAAACAMLARRAGREPLAYVLGEWGFRHLVLHTDARALVPRPETEIVVERALALLAGVDSPRVVDVGTGSGAIALAIASEHPGSRVSATDVSADALALAAENAAALGLPLELRRTSLLDGVTGPFDLVVSNPPYVRADELAALEPEVRDWEPRLALLDGGHSEQLADAARRVLVPGGAIVLEAHADHAHAVAALLDRLGYLEPRVTRDLAGRDRVVEARWERAR